MKNYNDFKCINTVSMYPTLSRLLDMSLEIVLKEYLKLMAVLVILAG